MIQPRTRSSRGLTPWRRETLDTHHLNPDHSWLARGVEVSSRALMLAHNTPP
jgi:hypothetical protein